MNEKFDFNDIYTWNYLSFPTYRIIMADHGENVNSFNFRVFMDYRSFCMAHGFLPYGQFSPDPIEIVYHQMKMLYQK